MFSDVQALFLFVLLLLLIGAPLAAVLALLPKPTPTPPELVSLVELSRRLGGELKWPSPYEAVVVGRSGEHQVELRVWLDRVMPRPAGEPALSVTLLLDRPLELPGRQRLLRVHRGELSGLTLSRGAQPALDHLMALGLDEVVLSPGRIEARVTALDAAHGLVDVDTTSQMVARLEALAAAIGARIERAPRVDATERVAATASTCPYCRTPVTDDPEACPACATLHHGECLREHGRCTVLGCRGRPGLRVQERA